MDPRFANIQIQDADPLGQLPADTTQPSHNEMKIVDQLFKKHTSTMNVVVNEMKDSFLVALIIVIMSLPQVDRFFERFFPTLGNSPHLLIGIKALVGGIGFWIIRYFYLCRKT